MLVCLSCWSLIFIYSLCRLPCTCKYTENIVKKVIERDMEPFFTNPINYQPTDAKFFRSSSINGFADMVKFLDIYLQFFANLFMKKKKQSSRVKHYYYHSSKECFKGKERTENQFGRLCLMRKYTHDTLYHTKGRLRL